MPKNSAARISHKQAAESFLRLASSGKVKEAFQLYVGSSFRHHNPFFRGDADALKSAMEENAAKNPEKVQQVQHSLEDGDFVAVHSRVTMKPGDPGVSTVHIFRFEDDRIVELWDAGQAMPANSPNENGLF